MNKMTDSIERVTMKDISARKWPVKKLLLVVDGAYVSVITPLGATNVSFPVYDPETGVLRVEEKDVEMIDNKPSIDADLTFAVIRSDEVLSW